MNRQAFMILVMGFNGLEALKFIQDFVAAFDAMETSIVDKDDKIVKLTGAVNQLTTRLDKLEYKKFAQREVVQRLLDTL